MSDLIERVRALNPVATCPQPSIDDVWRKLEHDETTEVEVVTRPETGRGSEFAGADGRRGASRRRRSRPSFSSTGLAVAIAVPVLIAAAALVALHHHNSTRPTPASHHDAAVQSASQRLADGTISCYFASSGPLHAMGGGADAGPDPATGESPIAFCRRWYGFNAHTGINAARVKFIACQSSPTNVAVYVSDGRPGQCERLGHGLLPAGYTAALRNLASLGGALAAIQHQHNCVTPAALAAEVRPALARPGFAGWRITLPAANPDPRYAPPAGTGGVCGEIVSNPPASAPQFNAPRRLVYISTGPPASIARFINRTSLRLYQRSYLHCFTAKSIRALVRQAFASTQMRPRFATTTSNGAQYEPGSQRLYNAGCVRLDDAIPANNSRYVDIVLVARTGTPLAKDWLYPKPDQFQP
jgi:hypothetical protein